MAVVVVVGVEYLVQQTREKPTDGIKGPDWIFSSIRMTEGHHRQLQETMAAIPRPPDENEPPWKQINPATDEDGRPFPV